MEDSRIKIRRILKEVLINEVGINKVQDGVIDDNVGYNITNPDLDGYFKDNIIYGNQVRGVIKLLHGRLSKVYRNFYVDLLKDIGMRPKHYKKPSGPSNPYKKRSFKLNYYPGDEYNPDGYELTGKYKGFKVTIDFEGYDDEYSGDREYKPINFDLISPGGEIYDLDEILSYDDSSDMIGMEYKKDFFKDKARLQMLSSDIKHRLIDKELYLDYI